MHRGPSIARSGSVTALPHVAASHAPAPRAQLTDIAQWGSAEDTARLLLPRGARLLSAAAAAVPQAPRDTGTPAGLVQPPPCTVYRCALDWSARQQGSMLDRLVQGGLGLVLPPSCKRCPRSCSGSHGCLLAAASAEQPPRTRARSASSSPASPCAARALALSARPRRAAGTSSACPTACTWWRPPQRPPGSCTSPAARRPTRAGRPPRRACARQSRPSSWAHPRAGSETPTLARLGAQLARDDITLWHGWAGPRAGDDLTPWHGWARPRTDCPTGAAPASRCGVAPLAAATPRLVPPQGPCRSLGGCMPLSNCLSTHCQCAVWLSKQTAVSTRCSKACRALQLVGSFSI